MPSHEHRHDGRFARPRRHLHGEAEELRIGFGVCGLKLRPDIRVVPAPARDLGQPNDGLDSFDLAEKGGAAQKKPLRAVSRGLLARSREISIRSDVLGVCQCRGH